MEGRSRTHARPCALSALQPTPIMCGQIRKGGWCDISLLTSGSFDTESPTASLAHFTSKSLVVVSGSLDDEVTTNRVKKGDSMKLAPGTIL